MQGLTMDYQLTLPAVLRRADQLFGRKEIVTRRPDRSFHRYTYADFVSRAKKLAVALGGLGLQKSDRVATLGWNTYQHLEAYFGVPSAGLVLHTLNPRLPADELAYIINHAGDKVLLIDETMVRLLDGFRDKVNLEHVFVFTYSSDGAPGGLPGYEELLAEADEGEFVYPDLDERDAAAMCYTSGTTGRPKGVLYSHRCICLHSLITSVIEAFGLSEADSVLPVVPMFHVNAWGIPFAATMHGAKQVFPGPHLDPQSLLEDFEQEKVTFTAGVPTVFLGILRELDKQPGRYDLSNLKAMGIGGAAAPEGMIRGFKERHGLTVLHAWGMTEMAPVGTAGHLTSDLLQEPEDVQYRYRAKQGIPLPFIEIRARGADGLVPWDGETMGELEVRGPTVASSYYEAPEAADKFTEDGWFRTGDIVTIDERGYIEIRDRDKDLVKSGGEWISSVELENALMGHPAVAEAAVIAVPHPKWQERPLAVVVLKEGESATAEELIQYIAPKFQKWQLPDAVEFVEEIPKTATGKFLKTRLRERFRNYQLAKS
ncbi:long-chain-fatty-acid--CoA ligase [Rubrobacter xylanophilus]|uniref:Long-chain-fatty-acid--CoA ligase n=1 Tax=Rubrobacter xylanophilus TaxID=49319 RepID=A0A510HMA6_9ACTN|nr:long-chain fatty acid--CoA ligase [Rubrobacter xylanophilus]BBL79713.1 long-chain-fatty-acid--CoA ligase [Rubrobacter xylanophilus]